MAQGRIVAAVGELDERALKQVRRMPHSVVMMRGTQTPERRDDGNRDVFRVPRTGAPKVGKFADHRPTFSSTSASGPLG